MEIDQLVVFTVAVTAARPVLGLLKLDVDSLLPWPSSPPLVLVS